MRVTTSCLNADPDVSLDLDNASISVSVADVLYDMAGRTRRGRNAIYTVPTHQTGNGLRDEEAAISGDGEGHGLLRQDLDQGGIELQNLSNQSGSA